jgi:hypothetical protein
MQLMDDLQQAKLEHCQGKSSGLTHLCAPVGRCTAVAIKVNDTTASACLPVPLAQKLPPILVKNNGKLLMSIKIVWESSS